VELARWNNRKLSGKDIPHVATAYRKGLGEIDLEKLTVLKLECLFTEKAFNLQPSRGAFV
jgi:hypothetical protein